MIIAIDIGNTNIVIGGISDRKTVFECRISTDLNKTRDEYTVLLKQLFEIYKISENDVEGSIISSVVPPVTGSLKRAVEILTGVKPMEVSVKMKHNIKIVTDNPEQIGSDLLVAAVSALDEFKPPLAIIDMGTATTITVIGKDNELLGVSIMPGVKISQEALVNRTSKLPSLSFEAPESVIGTNTPDSMKSGLIFGNASMIDGMLDRIEESLGEKINAVATGGLSGSIIKHCKRNIKIDDEIMIKGLLSLYERNK